MLSRVVCNSMFPSMKIPTNTIPSGWGLKDTSFYFAPEDGTFGGIVYQQGFSLTGTFSPRPTSEKHGAGSTDRVSLLFALCV